MNNVLGSIDSLLSQSRVSLDETSDDVTIVVPVERQFQPNPVVGALKALWEIPQDFGNLFELMIVMRRADTREELRIYRDGSTNVRQYVFRERWEVCNDCSDMLSSLGQLCSKRDYSNAAKTAVKFIVHLVDCTHRRASVSLEIIVRKQNLCQLAISEAGQLKCANLSFWYKLDSFLSWLTKLSLWDFFHIYAENLNAVPVVLVHRPEDLQSSSHGAFTIVAVRDFPELADPSQTAHREAIVKRMRKEFDEISKGTVFRNAPIVPPSMLFLTGQADRGFVERFMRSICKITFYSALCLVADFVAVSGNVVELGNDMAYGFRSVKMVLSDDDQDLIIEMVDDGVRKLKKDVCAEKTAEIYDSFFELLGRDIGGALRKTAVKELLKQRFNTIVELVLETKSMINYYATLRNDLLEKRIDELASVLQKISDSAVGSSRSLSEILESMQHDVTNLSMVLFGALLLQAYSYISKAITPAELSLFFLVFCSFCSLLLLLVDFRLSDVYDTGRFVRQTYFSLEQTLSQETGLKLPAWGELVENSYSNLVNRVQVVDILTWGAIAFDLLACYYLISMIGVYGYSARLQLAFVVGIAVSYLTVFLAVRRTKRGFEKIMGRTSISDFLIRVSLIVLCLGTSWWILNHWSEIAIMTQTVFGRLIK